MPIRNQPWRWSKLRGPEQGLRALRPQHRSLGGAPGAEGPHARIYGSQRWKDLQSRTLKARPYCSACGARGRRLYVDHIVEIRDAPELAFDPANVQVLCASCHQHKTAEARRARAG
jgi:hypothetical protein